MKYIRLMRVKQYIKNILIFAPIIFGLQITNIKLLKKSIVGFFIFSLVCSTIYIINDINDIEKDKLHEIKKSRPLASGAIKIKDAILLIIILFFSVIILNMLFINMKQSNIILLIYFILNILYSIKLKYIPLLDIVIIVSGFVLRLLYGGVITGIPISNLMYLTVISISFYLALGKRRNEILKCGTETRTVLSKYTLQFLDKNMYMFLGLSIIFYSLWCLNMNQNDYYLYTVPIVMLICMKYSMDIESDSFGDPADVIIGDKVLLILGLFYGILILFILYSKVIID